MSPSRPPATAAAIPASIARCVAAISAVSSGRGVPTVKLIAASPVQSSSSAPKSRDTRSPSRSRYAVGMPCTIASLTEVQRTAGKGVEANDGR